jgi:hypothetical protein
VNLGNTAYLFEGTRITSHLEIGNAAYFTPIISNKILNSIFYAKRNIVYIHITTYLNGT